MYDGNTPDNPHIPAWLVFDQRYRDRYVFAGLPPRRPLPRRWYAAGAVFRAQDLGKLAAAIGVDPDGLAQTVARFNEFARAGRDEEFHRGDSAYDRYYGDPRVRPNPNLAPLASAPFYAAKIVPGDLGTKGGLRTDGRARVLRPDGTPIPGLYAAGNASAAVMGHSYAGAGATIGPAMTFGYLAALDLTADVTGLSAPSPAPELVASGRVPRGQNILAPQRADLLALAASRLVAGYAVDLFPEDVGVTDVPGVLPDDVHVDPAQ